jgi:NTP pyrophosphatase (non-canonical NTP hydrolase)
LTDVALQIVGNKIEDALQEDEMNEQIIKEVLKFRDEREWKQFHNPKDLAISLSIEAAELLENFQWSTPEESVSKRLQGIREELADVLIYAILIAETVDLNIEEIIREKLSLNRSKYPIEKAIGRKEKYTEL